MRRLFITFSFLVLSGCAANHTRSHDETVRIGDSVIRVDIAPEIRLPRAVVIEWIRRGGGAVRTYLGRFPVDNVLVTVRGGGDEPIGWAVTHGASDIEVSLGPSA